MEDIIGFLILLITIVISVVASVKKQSGQNKTGEQSFENTSTESSGNEREMESAWSQRINETTDYRDEITDYEEEAGEENEESVEWRAAGEPAEAKEESPDSTVKTEKEGTAPFKETRKAKKRKQEKKSKIEEIKERFDVEEGIIYSEILNKKYF